MLAVAFDSGMLNAIVILVAFAILAFVLGRIMKRNK